MRTIVNHAKLQPGLLYSPNPGRLKHALYSKCEKNDHAIWIGMMGLNEVFTVLELLKSCDCSYAGRIRVLTTSGVVGIIHVLEDDWFIWHEIV